MSDLDISARTSVDSNLVDLVIAHEGACKLAASTRGDIRAQAQGIATMIMVALNGLESLGTKTGADYRSSAIRKHRLDAGF